jgi:hypothetical protein
MKSDGDKLYMKLVAFDEIYNVVVNVAVNGRVGRLHGV